MVIKKARAWQEWCRLTAKSDRPMLSLTVEKKNTVVSDGLVCAVWHNAVPFPFYFNPAVFHFY